MKAALYLRSSKDRSDVSIDAQRRALHELANAKDLVVVAEYEDAVESGKDDDRPGLQRMLDDLNAPGRPWGFVLALDTSRIARRRMLALIIETSCERRGVQIVYKSLSELEDDATAMLMRSSMQAFDEYHSLISRAKGLAGMHENVRQGWRAGGRAPIGYLLEQHATGAIRDGAPVTKSKLVLDPATAPEVAAYLKLRAAGHARGPALARVGAEWAASTAHGMDWNALTYAGHTVFGMHARRAGGKAVEGKKRRPRAEWLVQRGTHEPLIDDADAEAILLQCERSIQGRRQRETPLLLSGLLFAPDGRGWHGDGNGSYRLAKGKRIRASILEPEVLRALAVDLASDETVAAIKREFEAIAAGDTVDGRTIAGLEKRIAGLTTQINKTVDLAARLDDPEPVLTRVENLQHERAQLREELAKKTAARERREDAATITDDEIRARLASYLREIQTLSPADDRLAEARQALQQVVERIVLEPAADRFRVHYILGTGDNLASPRGFEPL